MLRKFLLDSFFKLCTPSRLVTHVLWTTIFLIICLKTFFLPYFKLVELLVCVRNNPISRNLNNVIIERSKIPSSSSLFVLVAFILGHIIPKNRSNHILILWPFITNMVTHYRYFVVIFRQ